MNRLRKKIRREITESGGIPFKRYMELCLYDPEFGYYRSSGRLGRDGDFFTSAHLGSVMGRVLGLRFISMASALPEQGETETHIVEMGAGQGLLANDLLEYLARNNLPLYQRTTYHLIEQNAALLAETNRNLKDHIQRVVFHEDLTDLPEIDRAFVFSNEFFDAFPVHVVTVQEGRLMELFVGYGEKGYTTGYREADDAVVREIEELGIRIPEGCQGEINTDIRNVYRHLSEHIRGLHMVTVDYGYTQDVLYHPDRTRGTLMGYHQHGAYDDVFQMEGDMDMTSHVNFDALIHHGNRFGMQATYFKNQRNYLMDHGLFDVFRDGEEPSTREAFQLKTLLLPGQMGDVFKVLVQVREGDSV